MVEKPVKAAQTTIEPSPRSSLDMKEPLLEEGFSVAYTAAPIHLLGATDSEGSSQYRKKNWKRWTRNLVSKPSIRVFFTLLVIAAISFSPALLSNPVPPKDPTFNLNDGSFNESEPNFSGVGP